MTFFNPALDAKTLKSAFAEDNRLRIPDILPAERAESLAQLLEGETKWRSFFNLEGKNYAVSPQEVLSMDPEEQQKLQQDILAAASRGEGFFYHGKHLAHDSNDAFSEILSALNDPATLDFIRTLTGDSSITHAIAQCTQFLPGHFLTRHCDDLSGETRRFAFVINLSRQWHPDWGGLLQFFEKDGTPRDSWTPEFNVLSLFATHHIHSVTYVAPFANVPRHGITGWFRSGDPDAQS